MIVFSTIPTKSARPDRFWQAVRNFFGLIICVAGATLMMAICGTEFLRFLLPFARQWPEFVQAVVLMVTLLVSVATGWVAAYFVIVKPLRLDE